MFHLLQANALLHWIGKRNDALQTEPYSAEGVCEGAGACCHWIADQHQALQARQPNSSLHIVHGR